MCSAVLDMVQVVVVFLHTHLAVGVLLVRNRLKKCHIMPVLDIVVCLNCLLEVLIIFSFSSSLNSLEKLHRKLLLRFVNAWTVAIGCLHVEPVDVVLLSLTLLGILLALCVNLFT